MVQLILEDGSIVAGANTFQTVLDVKTYASQRGVTLTKDDNGIAADLIEFTDFISTMENDFKGGRTSPTQSLPFPRKCLTFAGYPVSENEIHQVVKSAQCEYVLAKNEGIDPMGNSRILSQGVVSEETPDFKRQYTTGSISKSVIIPKVMALLGYFKAPSFRIIV